MALADLSLRDLLTAFSANTPTPGGGSASALASALGVSLLRMVAGLVKTRTGSDHDRAALTKAAGVLALIGTRLTDAIDADTAAYDRVVAAYQQTKASPQEQAARRDAVQQALHAATEVPLDVVRLSAEALDEAVAIAAHGHRGASSDVGVGVALLRAGAHGARLNVETNIGSLADVEYANELARETVRWSDLATRAADQADALLRV